ncbi:tetratricopeptide repeat protein [Galbibacter sp. EGI 63066]|uniref:tetratricopeptide repeat-containing sensor histidine kinase n=1 Tax=Galbibacter sp. EGI 63066 TaxID=2993559 RepID=UPI002248BC95|nr:tetratricopeptide repeat-containing sensor histidine kinase [Galbibacter sp. EGI 63066]MCX2681895.1 tetratricopeptide repeat protein [Galbibacter sp. EGI 63066]
MKKDTVKYRIAVLLFGIALMVLPTRCQKASQKSGQAYTDTEARVAGWISKAKTGQSDSASIYLKQAYKLLSSSKQDSTTGKYLWRIAYQALRQKDSILFKKVNKKSMALALKKKDSFALGHSHWNYGAWYLARVRYDSAYYHYGKALHLFENPSRPSSYSGQILYNMAIILSRLKDYTGAEVLAFKAITLLEPQEKYKQLYLCYNLLGVIYEELSEYDKAITYHTRALGYLEQLEDPGLYLLDSQNNIGLIYQKIGDQQKAITFFNKALDAPLLKKRDIALYARLLDNRAYSRLMAGDTVGLQPELKRALYLRDSTGNSAGVVVSKLHLASYHAYMGDTIAGIHMASEAYRSAQNIQNNRDVLKALLLLADLDLPEKPRYLREYISLNDGLIRRERQTRNKFTRIQYETDKYMERNQELSLQKAWILFIATMLVFTLVLFYIYYRQRAKNKLLQLETLQQKANEKIYLLAIKQQARFQQGKIEERIRISELLHDSSVADLYGIRVHWGYLKLHGDAATLKKHREYLTELKRIENQVRDASHSLKDNLASLPVNFMEIISHLAKKRARTGNFKVAMDIDPGIDWALLDNPAKVNLYYSIDEALQNCIKHARARVVTLKFSIQGQSLMVSIQDDGVGMSRKRTKGIGLKNIRSRTRKMKGSFTIDSSPGKGTALTVAIPYKT